MKHQHHEEAAQFHTEAAKHHTEAHKSHQEGNDEKAAHHALAANGNGVKAIEKSNDAAKAHAEKQNPKK